MNAPTHWTTDKERGTPLAIRAIVWVTALLGRPFGRLLLYPVTAYFWLSSAARRRASAQYLQVVFGRPARASETFQHYLCFAQVLLDRALLLLGARDTFAIRVSDGDVVMAALAEGRGCILMGAHFGSYDVLRAAAELTGLRIKIMMRVEITERFNAVMASLNPSWNDHVIPLGRTDTMLLAKEHLRSGGALGLLGDRLTARDKMVEARFFGRSARFPAGPYLLAQVLDAPIVAFFGAYEGDNRYGVHFERLELPNPGAGSLAIVGAASFAAQLEAACRATPYNWFNFYDFWARATPDA